MSLRAIGNHAGQSNNSAALYHFGSKQGLIGAIVEARSVPVNERRSHLIDELHAQQREFRVPEMLRVLVEPLSETVEDRQRTHYLRFLASVVADHGVREALDPRHHQPSSIRWVQGRLRDVLPQLSQADFQRRLEWGSMFSVQALADHERRRHSGRAGPEDTARTVRELVTVQTALLECPAGD